LYRGLLAPLLVEWFDEEDEEEVDCSCFVEDADETDSCLIDGGGVS